jgi:hypothetical protein
MNAFSRRARRVAVLDSAARTERPDAPATLAPTETAAPAPRQIAAHGHADGIEGWSVTYPYFTDWLRGSGATCRIRDSGIWTLPENVTQVFCAGGNSGTFWWRNWETGDYGSANFTAEHSYSIAGDQVQGAHPLGHTVNVYKVEITG